MIKWVDLNYSCYQKDIIMCHGRFLNLFNYDKHLTPDKKFYKIICVVEKELCHRPEFLIQIKWRKGEWRQGSILGLLDTCFIAIQIKLEGIWLFKFKTKMNFIISVLAFIMQKRETMAVYFQNFSLTYYLKGRETNLQTWAVPSLWVTHRMPKGLGDEDESKSKTNPGLPLWGEDLNHSSYRHISWYLLPDL